MLNLNQLNILRGRFSPPPAALPVLYHGTNDSKFFSRICLGTGFNSNQLFMANYSLNGFGGTAIYGPGIYTTTSLVEAQGYGSLIIEFRVASTTDYLDMTNPAGTGHAQAVGLPTFRILQEPQVYALIKVTAQYYVLRTPFNVIVSAH